MKYGYKDADNRDLIEKYETSGDKIIITFLDGTDYEIPLTEKNKNELLDLMLEQAQNRSKSSALYDAKRSRKKALRWVITSLVLTLINAQSFTVADSKAVKIIACILGCLTSISMLSNGITYKYEKDEIEELEKYDIYLSIKEALETNTVNPNLYRGVENEYLLDITTIDDYSLSDVKRIQSNLRRNEKYPQFFAHKKDAPKIKRKEMNEN